MWHTGGVEAALTSKIIRELPMKLVLALGPEVQLGHLATVIAMQLSQILPQRGHEHLKAVADVHRFALRQSAKPHDIVAQTWRVDRRTAQEWSRKARRAGLLGDRATELAALRLPPADSEPSVGTPQAPNDRRGCPSNSVESDIH
ncbi:hypothetical protein GCM10009663_57180 [Kitasatospora arboriphila]|uniref:ANTAR domain-containing protein n=2 Tax=Kitasatospora arboriphila TaxID=258052 RepID=A0ABN1TYY2_9ACTN